MRQNLFTPFHLIYFTILIIVTIMVSWLYIDLGKTLDSVSDDMIKTEIKTAKAFSKNIDHLLAKILADDPVATLTKHPELQEQINQILSLFSTDRYRYVYILYKDQTGKLRYLADGSKEINERGIFGQKFDANSDVWKKAYATGQPQYSMQNNYTGLWLTYYYPLTYTHQPTALLIFDISIDAYKNFYRIISPFRTMLITLSALLAFVLLLSFILAYLFYKQWKKNNIDPLTHLYNRNLLTQIANRIDLTQTTVIVADIDYFKRINDRFGHDVGDIVLKAVARSLLQAVRIDDIVIRYGGEEFLILLRNMRNKEQIKEIAHRILHEVSKHPIRIGKHSIKVTVSMGVNPYSGQHTSLDEAIQHADKMLYQAKASGRNRVVILDDQPNQETMLLLKEIMHAIESNQVKAFFQPVAHIESGDIINFETLARIVDKHGKIRLPKHFLPIIRGTNIYHELCKAMLYQAFNTIKIYQVHVTINFEMIDFYDNTLFEIIEEVIESYAEYSDHLTIELLEEHPIDDIETIVVHLERLRAFGIKVALDNFGKGYAGFDNLIHLKPDMLKIDGTIVKKAHHEQEARAILQSIATICKRLKIHAIAKCVEDEATITLLKECGIEYAQGFFIGRPSYAVPIGA